MTSRNDRAGSPSRYALDGDIASGTLFGQDFAFDLSTNIVTGTPRVAGAWIADTENRSAIACE